MKNMECLSELLRVLCPKCPVYLQVRIVLALFTACLSSFSCAISDSVTCPNKEEICSVVSGIEGSILLLLYSVKSHRAHLYWREETGGDKGHNIVTKYAT